MTGPELAGLVVAVALLGFAVWGLLAYLGSWRWLRGEMLRDQEGYRHAAGLPLGLLLLPAVLMTWVPAAHDGGLAWPHVAALCLGAALLVWAAALCVGGGHRHRLTRAVSPRWWLRARSSDRAAVRDSSPQAALGAGQPADGRPER